MKKWIFFTIYRLYSRIYKMSRYTSLLDRYLMSQIAGPPPIRRNPTTHFLWMWRLRYSYEERNGPAGKAVFNFFTFYCATPQASPTLFIFFPSRARYRCWYCGLGGVVFFFFNWDFKTLANFPKFSAVFLEFTLRKRKYPIFSNFPCRQVAKIRSNKIKISAWRSRETIRRKTPVRVPFVEGDNVVFGGREEGSESLSEICSCCFSPSEYPVR